MDISIPFGDATMPLSVPDERLLGILAVEAVDSVDEKHLLRASVDAPCSSRNLRSFADEGEPLLILVNDATRPTPTALLLENLWPEIGTADVTFLVATGTHRAPSDDELQRIFGGLWPEVSERVFIHDSRDSDQLVSMGSTSRGNEVLLNHMVAAAEKLLVLSSVETHYFAGFTGGRKIILPGVAGFETIENNHRLAMEPGADVLRLDGNPVNMEMEEALGFLADKELFAVLSVLDREHHLYSVYSGDIGIAFRKATADVRRLFTVPFNRKAEIVVAVATHPLDMDFYQAQKAIENGKLALREGGTLILISACRDGIGNDAFLRIMSKAGAPEQVMGLAEEDYHLGYHKAARLAELAMRVKLHAVVGVEDGVARTAFMEPFATAQDALDSALADNHGANVRVLMDAGTTVPLSP